MVNVIKPEYVKEYAEWHRNPWREVLESIRDAGTKEELIFIYKNYAILFVECEDIHAYMKEFIGSEAGTSWMAKMYYMLGDNDWADENGHPKNMDNGLEKVFDLQQMLDGNFSPY
jgi:L-rhamnose mutarotase